MIECSIPNTNKPFLQIRAALDILKEMNAESKSNNKAIDLSLKKVEWMLPCSVLLLSHKITELTNKGIKFQIIEPGSSPLATYLRRVGFPLGGKPKGQTFQPIRHFSKDANKEANVMFDVVKNTFPDNEKYSEAVFYVLAELSANVDEHSGFNHASMMAQSYQDCVDIGVLDNGASIPKRFEEAGVKFSEDAEAIDMALEGVSTKKTEGNRGHGLPSTKEIITNGLKGNVYMVSRMGALVTGHVEAESFYTSKSPLLKGTFVYLRFPKPERKVDIYPYIK